MAELYLFDVDKTITEFGSTELFPQFQHWLTYYRKGRPVALVTNQGGVGLRYWLQKMGKEENDFAKYPTEAEVYTRLGNLQEQIGKPSLVLVCFAYQSKNGNWSPMPPGAGMDWESGRRKPSGAMLVEACKFYNIMPWNAIMVGDQDTDMIAAEKAGVKYYPADEFFAKAISL